MFRLRLRRPSPALVLAGVALVAALGGVAIASPVGSDGKVHLCYSQALVDTQDGNLIVPVNVEDECPVEFPDRLVVNQTGPKGSKGPTGPPGTPGLEGPIGPPGIGVQPIEDQIAKKVKKDLRQLERRSDKEQKLLEHHKKKVAALKKRSGEANADKLARQVQEFSDRMQVIADLIARMARTNREVVNQMAD